MGHPESHTKTFYGIATIGAKGQIVIPAKAREDLKLEPGDSLVVVGIRDHGMLGLCPVESVEAMLQNATRHLDELKTVIEKTKEEDVKEN